MGYRDPRRWLPAALLLVVQAGAMGADLQVEAYKAMGIKPTDVLAGTVLQARVMPGDEKQVVCLATYFTGKHDKTDAVSVRLSVFARRGEALTSLYTRDFGAEEGGLVGDGNLQVLDLSLDGVNEIIASYDRFRDPLVEQRVGEVIVHEPAGFRTAWSGPLEYDATRAARDVPPERRDRYRREIDIAETLRTRGVTLFFKKTVIALAGERLPEPQVVQETFPVRPRS